MEKALKDYGDMPGHLARRYQQLAVAIFYAEVGACGSDLTPVQFAALAALQGNPGIDQITLAALIAYDRTTIAGVVDRLARKGYVLRKVSERDRRASELYITDEGVSVLALIEPGVDATQRLLVSGLSAQEADTFLNLMRKAIEAIKDFGRAPIRTP